MTRPEMKGDVTIWYRDGTTREMDNRICGDVNAFVLEWNRGLDGKPQQIVRITMNIFVGRDD